MKKNPNWLRLIAMFFTIAALICLGNIQGNAAERPNVSLEYVLDQSPPAVITAISSPSECIQISRGVSVPIKELILATSEKSIRESRLLYLYTTKEILERQFNLADMCSPVTESRLQLKDRAPTELTLYRAREKV